MPTSTETILVHRYQHIGHGGFQEITYTDTLTVAAVTAAEDAVTAAEEDLADAEAALAAAEAADPQVPLDIEAAEDAVEAAETALTAAEGALATAITAAADVASTVTIAVGLVRILSLIPVATDGSSTGLGAVNNEDGTVTINGTGLAEICLIARGY